MAGQKPYSNAGARYYGLSLRAKITLLVCSVSVTTSLVLGAIYYDRTSDTALKITVEGLAHEARLVALNVKGSYDRMRNDAFVISRTPPIQGLVRSIANNNIDPTDGSTSAMWRGRLAAIFSSIIEARPSYTQIRYIGVAANGRELVRVERLDGVPNAIANEELQEKADENYFREALTLHSGESHFSEVTYNREYGRVVYPRVPTLRLVVPVFDSDGRMFGMIVINADYKTMLRQVLGALSTGRAVSIINSANDYMSRRADGTITPFRFHDNPLLDELDTIQAVTSHTGDEWYAEDKNQLVFYVRVPTNVERSDSHIVVATAVPRDVLYRETRTLLADSGILIVGLMLLSLLAAAVLASRITRPIRQVTQAVRQAAWDGSTLTLPVKRRDEIGELASAFKNLADGLSRSEGRNHAILAGVLDGVVTIDDKGIVKDFNPSASKIFGYAIEEVVGKNVKMLLPELVAVAHDGYIRNYMNGGPKKFLGKAREVEGKRKDGSLVPLEISTSEIIVSNGRLFTGIVRDITERKEVERLKSDFISTVSHELRTPLTSIQGALGLVAGPLSAGLPQKGAELLQIAYKNSKRLSLIVNDILDIDKISEGKMRFEPGIEHLASLVDQAVADHEAYGEKYSVRVVFEQRDDALYIEVDRHRFAQIVSNLLSNAIKYSRTGETVDVSVTGRGDSAVVTVRDHGEGISPEFGARIFERFSRADSSASRSREGTGLGLHISKLLVEMMSGKIGFESTPGVGSSFWVSFPKAAAPDKTEAEPARDAVGAA